MSHTEENAKAAPTVEEMDWDHIARNLKDVFDQNADAARTASWSSDKRPYWSTMAEVAEALVKVSAEARAARNAGNAAFKLNKKA